MPTSDAEDAFEIIKPEEQLDPDVETSKEVAAWVQTFRQEWKLDEDATKSTSTKLRDQLAGLAEDCLISLRYTIKHESNANLKLKATLWLLDSLLSDKGALRIDDPLVAFLEEMRAASPPSKPIPQA